MTRYMRKHVNRFASDERGTMTHLALTVCVLVIWFAGFSLDSTNARRVRAMLQIAADSTAHAAVVELQNAGQANVDNEGKNSVRNAVMYLANANLTADSVGNAITSNDITFGKWNTADLTFTETNQGVNAVRVVAQRTEANNNALPTFLLRLGVLQSWDISAEAISAFVTSCTTPDIATNGSFEITSNNAVYNDYCIYGVQGIKLNNSNTYSDEAVLLVKSEDDIQWPGSVGMDTVVGRGTSESAADLTYQDVFSTDVPADPIVPDVDAMAANFLNPYYANQPSYINTAASVITISAKDVRYTAFQSGRIYEVICGGSNGSKAQFFRNTNVSEVVIVSECNLQLGNNSSFEDVVLVTTSTGTKSVYGANGVRLGADDSCTNGGGVTVYTKGDFSSASNMEAYDALLYVEGGVHLAAKANGVGGLRIYANDDVTFSAQAQLGLCKDEDSPTAVAARYKLVR